MTDKNKEMERPVVKKCFLTPFNGLLGAEIDVAEDIDGDWCKSEDVKALESYTGQQDERIKELWKAYLSLMKTVHKNAEYIDHLKGRIRELEVKPKIDDLLLQEISSLRNRLDIAYQIILSYDPDLDLSVLIHNLSSTDLQGAYEFNQEYESKIKELEAKLEEAKMMLIESRMELNPGTKSGDWDSICFGIDALLSSLTKQQKEQS